MPRRRKGQDAAFGILIILALFVWVFSAIRDSVGLLIPIAAIVGTVVLTILCFQQKKRKRIEYLTRKYGEREKRYIGDFYAHLLDMDAEGNPYPLLNFCADCGARTMSKCHGCGAYIHHKTVGEITFRTTVRSAENPSYG